jgi:hypothetical protein
MSSSVRFSSGECGRKLQRASFTLAEAIISILIVSVMSVAALSAVERTAQVRLIAGNQQIALALANQLMAEILSQPYCDPAVPNGTTIGPGPGEVTGTRVKFNDVDDCHNWSESPPTLTDGTTIPNRSRWYRTVKVDFVRRENLQVPVAGDYGLKSITIEVGTLAPGGTVGNAADRMPVIKLTAVAGRGR